MRSTGIMNNGSLLATREISSSNDGGTAQAGVGTILQEFESKFVGLTLVKQRIAEIAALIALEDRRANLRLAARRPSLHMSFSGNAGCGKRTVAMHVAEVHHRLGYFKKGQFVAVVRSDLVGRCISDTARKTRRALRRAMGGVLYIEQAHNLVSHSDPADCGQDALQILLRSMEGRSDDLAVIFAGFSAPMKAFLLSNPTLRSRIAHHLTFPDYGLPELMQIADRLMERDDYCFGQGSRDVFEQYLALLMQTRPFANARSVLNAIDRARQRQARRLRQGPPSAVTTKALITIEPRDIQSSHLFMIGQY